MESVSVMYPRRPKAVNVPTNMDDVVVLLRRPQVCGDPRTMTCATKGITYVVSHTHGVRQLLSVL
jgi:hypothetical protein